MKTVWKWIIGIVIVLVIVAVIVGGVFMLHSHMLNLVRVTRVNRPSMRAPGNGTPSTGNNGKVPSTTNGNGYRRFPGMMPFGNGNWGGRGMYMGGFGMMGFGRMMPFGGLFGGLVALGILVLIVLAIIWLVRSLRKPAAPTAAVVPVVPAVAVHPCQKCGGSVQEGWQFCPHCGEKL